MRILNGAKTLDSKQMQKYQLYTKYDLVILGLDTKEIVKVNRMFKDLYINVTCSFTFIIIKFKLIQMFSYKYIFERKCGIYVQYHDFSISQT